MEVALVMFGGRNDNGDDDDDDDDDVMESAVFLLCVWLCDLLAAEAAAGLT